MMPSDLFHHLTDTAVQFQTRWCGDRCERKRLRRGLRKQSCPEVRLPLGRERQGSDDLSIALWDRRCVVRTTENCPVPSSVAGAHLTAPGRRSAASCTTASSGARPPRLAAAPSRVAPRGLPSPEEGLPR